MNNILNLVGKVNKDCKVFNPVVEDEAISQIYKILDSNGFENVPIRIMPDVHNGAGIVIGFTAPLTNVVNPEHIGVDIGCSVTMCVTNTPIVESEIPLIEHRIKSSIPMGFDIHKNRIFEMKEFIKFIKSEYDKAHSSMPDIIQNIVISENTLSNMLKRIGMDEGTFYKSLGTLGGGNHFIELGNLNGNYTFAVHCGSRNFGLKVCKYWNNIANKPKFDNKIFKQRIKELKNTIEDVTLIPAKIEEIRNELLNECPPNGYLAGDDFNGYITDMVIAQAYAKFNHLLITRTISDILKKINGAKIVETIQSIHNYIDMEDCIIRKGAIRSYENEKMLVPFNMRDGIAICYGKSNPDWNYSCSHGAGRKLSRGRAKSLITIDEFKKSMEGIYSTTVGYDTLDESPMAYKDSNTIINLISDTCEIIDVVKPIINIKAGEDKR